MSPRMMPFKYYLDYKDVEKVSADIATARSMLGKAQNRLDFVKSLKIEKMNATFVFEDIYEVLRECAQCLMMADGYRSKNSQEAAIAFVKDFYGEDYGDKLINDFDRYRRMLQESRYRTDYITEDVAIASVETSSEFVRITTTIFAAKYPEL